MANNDIYQVPTTNSILWGRRVYYSNCHKQDGDFPWHKDNLTTAGGTPKASEITPGWVFKNKWFPEK